MSWTTDEGVKIPLSIDEAKALYKQLDKLFGARVSSWPDNIKYYKQPSWIDNQIYCSTSQTETTTSNGSGISSATLRQANG